MFTYLVAEFWQTRTFISGLGLNLAFLYVDLGDLRRSRTGWSRVSGTFGLAFGFRRLADGPFGWGGDHGRLSSRHLVTFMLEEVTLDAGREGFCDKGLGQSKLTHIKLNETVDGLTASFEGGRSQITQLTQDITWLNQELSDLAASLKVATDMRVA